MNWILDAMKKRLISGLLILFVVIFLFIQIYDHELKRREDFRWPNFLSSYSSIGFYKINSETILTHLNGAEENIFTLLEEDPNRAEDSIWTPISWRQEDFQNIANALGEGIWDDPMDLGEWDIYSIYFRGNCKGEQISFYSADITYFKTIEVNGKKVYSTRYIEIRPEYSWIRVGSGAIYSRPILHRWKGVCLDDANVSAEEALIIADENGGKEARLIGSPCSIFVSSSRFRSDIWEVSYLTNPILEINVNMNTGKFDVGKHD